MAFRLNTPAFTDGGPIPLRHTCDGQDLSPPLAWSDPPGGAKSFALIMDDPDAPSGTFTHWVLFDVPAATRELAEGQRPGGTGQSGRNDFGRAGYGGPCPPRGHGSHRYGFTVYALDVATIGASGGAARDQVEQAIKGHLLGTAKLMGRYERKK